jgi:hypothetical protein
MIDGALHVLRAHSTPHALGVVIEATFFGRLPRTSGFARAAVHRGAIARLAKMLGATAAPCVRRVELLPIISPLGSDQGRLFASHFDVGHALPPMVACCATIWMRRAAVARQAGARVLGCGRHRRHQAAPSRSGEAAEGPRLGRDLDRHRGHRAGRLHARRREHSRRVGITAPRRQRGIQGPLRRAFLFGKARRARNDRASRLAIEAPAPRPAGRQRPGILHPPLKSRAWLLWEKAAVVADMPGHLLLIAPL